MTLARVEHKRRNRIYIAPRILGYSQIGSAPDFDLLRLSRYIFQAPNTNSIK